MAKWAERQTKRGALTVARNNGFAPRTVVDVGFGFGTDGLYEVFEGARYVIVEPIAECEPLLRKICEEHPGSVYELAAASDTLGQTDIVYRPGVTGSTIHGRAKVEGEQQRSVSTVTLDHLEQVHGLEPPYLLKLDAEGHEIKVLSGATTFLRNTEMVICEVNTWSEDNPKGRASLDDIFGFCRQAGFVLYDIIEPGYRPIDNAMQQFDAIFVKKESPIRSRRSMKSPEQAQASRENKKAKFEQALAALSVEAARPSEQVAEAAPAPETAPVAGPAAGAGAAPGQAADTVPAPEPVLATGPTPEPVPASASWDPGAAAGQVELPVPVYADSPRCRRVMENVTVPQARAALKKFLRSFETVFDSYYEAWESRSPYWVLEQKGGNYAALARKGAVGFRLDEADRNGIIRSMDGVFDQLLERRAANPASARFSDNVMALERQDYEAPFAAVDGAFARLGVYDLVDAFCGKPLRLSRIYAQINDVASTAASWGEIGEDGLPRNRGDYIHIDSKFWPPLKVLLYASEVGPDQGPFRYVPGSHRWHDGFETVVRKTNDQLKPSLEEFLALPEQFRKHSLICSHLGAVAPGIDPIIAQEVPFLSEAGDLILFDPNLLHRGGFVREGERRMLQCAFA